tara:strand:- start:44 stop:1372 length:1329 start_codon:yes stop_codon:yes gene_type:complete
MSQIETTYKVDYKGEHAWGYKLINKINDKWYYGKGKGNIEEYDTGSYSPELMSAISKGEIRREIVKVDESYISIGIWETQLLTEKNAENDPMSYNENNGFDKIKKIPRVSMCKEIADEIRKHKSYCNHGITDIDLTGHKDYKGKIGFLKSTSFINDWDYLQPRYNLYVADHLKDLTEKIDQYKGNLEAIESETGQLLFSVVLINRKILNKPKTNQTIDGNHTQKATIQSRYGYKLKVLYIPESIHSDWSDDEVRMIAEYLNPRNKMTTLQTAEEDVIKTATALAIKYGKESSVITDYINQHNFNNKAKDRIKKNVSTKINQIKKAEARPKNFIDWTLPEWKEILKKKVSEREKEPGTYSVYWSSGKAGVGDYCSKMLRILYQGNKGKIVKKIHCYIHHPDNDVKKDFKKEIEQDFKNWQRIFKHEDVELTWEEMPTEKEENN